jgi:hypothetical protein
MLSKAVKARIKHNEQERLRRRHIRLLQKYFIKSLIIPIPARSQFRLKDFLKEAGITDKQMFLAKYTIVYYPAHRKDKDIIYGQFVRSIRDPSFCSFMINVKTKTLHGLTVEGFQINLEERRAFDLRPNPNNCSTCKYKAMNDGEPGHCYMFRDEPQEVCMQHSGRADMFIISPKRYSAFFPVKSE